MTLREWVAQHPDEIISEDASRTAVAPLLAVIAREITDAEGVPSDDGRLQHAFAACLAAARAALAACGLRIRPSAHHRLAIESLQHTLGLPDSEIRHLDEIRRMRARAVYDQVGIASRGDAQAALAAARGVADRLTTWLAHEHPDISPK